MPSAVLPGDMDLERGSEEEPARRMVPQFTGACLRWFQGTPSWRAFLSFVLLTFNSGIALYRSQDDPWAIYFVAFTYVNLMLLFCLLKMDQNGQPTNSRRIWIVRASVWTLTALLAFMFSYKVAAMLPFPMAAIVWVMSAATVAGVFFAFFSHN